MTNIDKAALSSRASLLETLGKISEVLAVLASTFLLGLFWLSSGRLIAAAVIVIGTLGLLMAAAEFSFRGRRASEKLARATEQEISMHVISETRIQTLSEEKVPNDVTSYLRSLLQRSVASSKTKSTSSDERLLIPTADLIYSLRKGLGPERTNEVKDVVLKYTQDSSEA